MADAAWPSKKSSLLHVFDWQKFKKMRVIGKAPWKVRGKPSKEQRLIITSIMLS